MVLLRYTYTNSITGLNGVIIKKKRTDSMAETKPIDELVQGISLQESSEFTAYDFVPKSFDDYLGQKELKKKLKVYTQAAIMRGEALDHLLLFGPPGLGKTTLSHIMARVMNVGIKICSGPILERNWGPCCSFIRPGTS